MHSKRAVIIDGNSLFYRAYYAIKANINGAFAALAAGAQRADDQKKRARRQ